MRPLLQHQFATYVTAIIKHAFQPLVDETVDALRVGLRLCSVVITVRLNAETGANNQVFAKRGASGGKGY
jgi:hypothetical protein